MKINLRVKQQRNTMTGSKIRRGVLPHIEPSILFRERGKKQLTIGTNNLMTSDNDCIPTPKLDSEESYILSSSFGISR